MDEMTRRKFLEAAGIAAAGIAGIGPAARAQEQEQEQEQDQDQEQEQEREQEKEEKPKAEEEEPKEEEPNYDDLFGDGSSEDEETRACPQCGALMYRQGRTWTCETCGYSYVE